MNWNEFLQWSRIGFIASCALVVQLTLSLAANECARELKHSQSADRPVPAQSVLQPANPPSVGVPAR